MTRNIDWKDGPEPGRAYATVGNVEVLVARGLAGTVHAFTRPAGSDAAFVYFRSALAKQRDQLANYAADSHN